MGADLERGGGRVKTPGDARRGNRPKEMTSRVRPLAVRPGARYRCFGDGLCCSDMHVLGPVGRAEARALDEGQAPPRTHHHRALGARALTVIDGRCAQLGEGGCGIYEARPSPCRRYPYRLVATPTGGRIATEHRCPCRTLGERPPIDVDDASRSLRVGGRLVADMRIGREIMVDSRSSRSFEAHVEEERALLEALAGGADALALLEGLGATPLPPLSIDGGLAWAHVGHHLRSHIDGSACGEAMAMVGDVLLAACGALPPRPLRARPWRWAFDRAEARSPIAGAPDEIERDALADALWSFEGVDEAPLHAVRGWLATRFHLARIIAAKLESTGARADRAMAEALAVTEIAFASPVGRGALAALADSLPR